MTENQTAPESKDDLRIVDILQTSLPAGAEPRFTKPKLVLLDIAILLAQLIRTALILAQFAAAAAALIAAGCYILGINPDGRLPYTPYFPGLALSFTLVLAALYFGFSAFDESAREVRLVRAYLKYRSAAWAGKTVEFSANDDDAPIAGRETRAAQFAGKAGRLLLLALPAVFMILSACAGWRLPWEAWGWFK